MSKIMKIMALVLALMAVLSVQAAEKKEGMTLDDIAKLRSVASAAVSPDGNWIAYVRTQPRKPYQDKDGSAWRELYLISSDGKESKPFITGEVNIGRVRWSDDGKYLYYLAKRHGDKQVALYRMPIDGGESRKWVSHETSIADYTVHHSGEKVVFIAKDKVAKEEKERKKKGFNAKVYEEQLRPNHLWLWTHENKDDKAKKIPFDTHALTVQFNPVDSRLLVQSAPRALIDDVLMEKKMQVIDIDGAIKSKVETRGKQEKALWSNDGKKIAFLGANDYNDPTAGAVYVVDACCNKKARKIKANQDSHIMDIAWHGGEVYYIEHKDAESRVVRHAKTPEVIVAYNEGIQQSISVSKTGKVVLVTNTAKHPNEVYVAQERLTDSNTWLNDIRLGKQEVLNYSAQDGLSLQGILVYPVAYKKGKRYPMIAFVHGGPESHQPNGWNTRYADPVQVAAAQGYVSFIPNYRGSTGRGDAFARADQHGYADPEFTDIVDGKNVLVQRGIVDAKKVGITGGSYGGFATAWSATALSEHYAAGVMFVGISNQLSKFGTTDIPNEMHAVHSRAWPWDDFNWMLERSPIYHIKKANTPLLILHGEKDTRVHPSQSLELYRYLKTIDQAPVRLVLYPNEAHGNRRAAAQMDYSMRLMRWMDHYLKGKGGNPPAHPLPHQERLSSKKK